MLALAGSACILFSVAMGGGLALYYCGVAFIFYGVWLNGSLLFLLEKSGNIFPKTSGIKSLNFNDQTGKLKLENDCSARIHFVIYKK